MEHNRKEKRLPGLRKTQETRTIKTILKTDREEHGIIKNITT